MPALSVPPLCLSAFVSLAALTLNAMMCVHPPQQKMAALNPPTADRPTALDKDVALAMHHSSAAFTAMLAGV